MRKLIRQKHHLHLSKWWLKWATQEKEMNRTVWLSYQYTVWPYHRLEPIFSTSIVFIKNVSKQSIFSNPSSDIFEDRFLKIYNSIKIRLMLWKTQYHDDRFCKISCLESTHFHIGSFLKKSKALSLTLGWMFLTKASTLIH